jgi:hypothetical protein
MWRQLDVTYLIKSVTFVILIASGLDTMYEA